MIHSTTRKYRALSAGRLSPSHRRRGVFRPVCDTGAGIQLYLPGSDRRPVFAFLFDQPVFCPPAAHPAGKDAAGSGTDARYAARGPSARGPAAEPGARPDGQGRTQRRGIRAPSESADGPAVIAPFEHRGRFFETGWECAGKSGGLPDLGGQRAGKTRARCGRRQERSRSLYVCYWGNHVTWI